MLLLTWIMLSKISIIVLNRYNSRVSDSRATGIGDARDGSSQLARRSGLGTTAQGGARPTHCTRRARSARLQRGPAYRPIAWGIRTVNKVDIEKTPDTPQLYGFIY